METNNVWIRHTHPTVYELAPYGTIWKAKEDVGHTLFIQLGKDGVVNWVKMGDFLEMVFGVLLENPKFIDQCDSVRTSEVDKKHVDFVLFENFQNYE
jgi:hypothetical protein